MPDDELDTSEVEPDVCMLVVEDGENGLEVDDPSGRLSSNERVGLLVRALIGECLPDFIFTPDDEDDE